MVGDLDGTARERAADGGVERSVRAELARGLQGGREIGAVRTEDRRARAHLRRPGGSRGIRAEVVVEAPRSHPFAQCQ